jgi:hypothetical protein
MSVREVNVNSSKTQVIKSGEVIDANSTCTKEIRTSRQTAAINIWGSTDRPPPIDSNLPAKMLAREMIRPTESNIGGGGTTLQPTKITEAHVFTVLLWSRLYTTPGTKF